MNDEQPAYGITPVDYFNRLCENIDAFEKSGNTAHLVYAALELRFCIETTLFEYLWLISGENLSKSVKKLYDAKDLKATILAVEPFFLEKLDFIGLLAYLGRDLDLFVKPNLDLLSSTYGKLGNYLHARKFVVHSKADAQRWNQLQSLMVAPKEHLNQILEGPCANVTFTDAGFDLIKRYSQGEISREQAEKIIIENWNLIFSSLKTSYHF